MEEIKKKRGRPRKTPIIPLVDENAQGQRLEMTKEKKVTTEDIIEATKALYAGYGKNKAESNLFDLQLYNPFLQNQRLKMINELPVHLEKGTIIDALKAPQNSEQPLRGAAWELSSTQYLYYRILREACDVPIYKYYKIPELQTQDVYGSKDFENEDKFLDEWLEKLSVVNTFKRMALEVKREGKCTYVLRNSTSISEKGQRKVDYVNFEKLPPQYVKLTAIGERGYIASFNMMIFMNPAFSPTQYPPCIQELWQSMIDQGVVTPSDTATRGRIGLFETQLDKMKDFKAMYQGKPLNTLIEIRNKKEYLFWVQLPQEICYTFASDMSHPWVLPDTAGLFLDLQELSDYGVLAGLIASTPLTAILTGEAELVNNPQTGRDQSAINPETLIGLQNLFNSMTSTNTEAFFAPLKNLKLQSLDNVPNSNEIKTSAVQNFVSVAGEGGIVVTTDKPSVAQVKGAQLLAASQADYVTRQFERVVNFIINELLGIKYHWSVKIWGDIYSLNDEKKFLKEMVAAGMKAFLPKLLSAEDLSVRDGAAVVNYVDSLKIYDKFETLTNTQTQENNQLKGAVGRPKLEDDEIENDSTAQSRDLGEDTTENKNQ